MMRPPEIPDEALKRLAQYWGRAELMRDLFHALRELHGDIQSVIDTGDQWELDAYLAYWLAGLFVVVEGFNKLRLKDARVQRLFHAHLNDLKQMRHETYHFTVSWRKGSEVLKRARSPFGAGAVLKGPAKQSARRGKRRGRRQG